MTETARVYGGSLYELAQEEHLEEEILFRDEGDPSSVPGKSGVSAPFIGAFDSAKRADRADRRGIWQPGGTVFGQFYQTAV